MPATRKTNKPEAGEFKLPAKTHDMFMYLAEDAGNWGGMPWLEGNANFGRGASAMSQKIVEAGLGTIGHGDENKAFLVFTDAGVAYANRFGVSVHGEPVTAPEPDDDVADLSAQLVATLDGLAGGQVVGIDKLRKAAAEPKPAPEPEAPKARKPASKADPANITETNLVGFPVAPWIPEQLRDRVGNRLDGHAGYYVRVPFASFAFAARMEDVDGPNWLVVCAHGTTHPAPDMSGPEGCEKTASRRAEWCEQCATAKASSGTSTPAAAIAKRAAHGAVAKLLLACAANPGYVDDIESALPEGIDRSLFAHALVDLANYHNRLVAKAAK